MKDLSVRTLRVKELALSLGFTSVGVSKSTKLIQEEAKLADWLHKGYHGKMKWMENHFDKRLDTQKLVPGSQSVISLLYNYYPTENYSDAEVKIAKYAYGADYHHVVKSKLKELVHRMEDEFGSIQGRAFVDSAPVMERQWAAKSGLGWIGKHSLLLSKQRGSYFFLAELIIDLPLDSDTVVTDHCGSCTACIDACPTDAIVQEGVIDATKCISYLTIELKEAVPGHFKSQMEGWAFGCDICQDVCPWNRFSVQHAENQFTAHPMLKELHQNDWVELTEGLFRDVFKKSAVKRAGFIKLRETIDWLREED